MNGTTIYNTGKTSAGVQNIFTRRPVTKNSYAEIFTQTVEKNSAEMTLDEYKNYFAQKLSAIPFDATRSDDAELIHISNGAWHALKNNPAYEEKILAQISGERASRNQLHGFYSGGEMKVRYIEARLEDCRTISTEDDKLANLKYDADNFLFNGNKNLLKRLRTARENFLTQELFKQVGTLQQLKLQRFL